MNSLDNLSYYFKVSDLFADNAPDTVENSVTDFACVLQLPQSLTWGLFRETKCLYAQRIEPGYDAASKRKCKNAVGSDS